MIFSSENGLGCYQFEHLAAYGQIRHAVFPRTLGASRAPFHRLNVSFSVGDDPAHVRANRDRVRRSLQAAELVFVHQVHGDGVRVVDDLSDARTQPPADAMVSALPAQALTVQVADCQPILYYDPQRRVVAAAHSGWRGSLAGVAVRTLEVMAARFGCSARDVLVGIGPSLGPCCAEFRNYRDEIPSSLWGYRRGAAHFDFWAVTRDQLIGAGVPAAHIENSGMCTKCRTDRFFSYRGERTTGRFPAAIVLRPGEERATKYK